MEKHGNKIRTVLVTGQSSKWHNWQVSSAFLRELLEASGRFAASVEQTRPPGGDLAGFAPR